MSYDPKSLDELKSRIEKGDILPSFMTLVRAMCFTKKLDMVKYLLEIGVSSNADTYDIKTDLLYRAITGGRENFAHLLLDYGACVSDPSIVCAVMNRMEALVVRFDTNRLFALKDTILKPHPGVNVEYIRKLL